MFNIKVLLLILAFSATSFAQEPSPFITGVKFFDCKGTISTDLNAPERDITEVMEIDLKKNTLKLSGTQAYEIKHLDGLTLSSHKVRPSKSPYFFLFNRIKGDLELILKKRPEKQGVSFPDPKKKTETWTFEAYDARYTLKCHPTARMI